LGGWIPIRTVFIINGMALLVIAVLMKTKFAIQAPAKESRDVKADHSTA
jgi:DHA1 family multidrug resistance protein-like MFS transporter